MLSLLLLPLSSPLLFQKSTCPETERGWLYCPEVEGGWLLGTSASSPPLGIDLIRSLLLGSVGVSTLSLVTNPFHLEK